MVEKLTNRTAPFKSAMYSMDGYQRMLTGAPFTPAIINAGEGIVRFEDYDNLANGIADMTSLESESLMAETCVTTMMHLLPIVHSIFFFFCSVFPVVTGDEATHRCPLVSVASHLCPMPSLFSSINIHIVPRKATFEMSKSSKTNADVRCTDDVIALPRYAAVLESSIDSTEFLGKVLGNTTLKSGNDFVSKLIVNGAAARNHLALQFLEVSKVIQLDTTEFETERSMFYTTIGGWDSHGTVDISTQLNYVDEAVGMLADELKDQGVWDDVAVVCLSDFGRTLNSNSQGTDHG